MSFSMWVNPAQFDQGWMYLLEVDGDCPWANFDELNQFGWGFMNSTSQWNGVSTTGPVTSINTWYHLAGVYNGTHLQIYLNGVLNNTAVAVGQPFQLDESGVEIGGGWAGWPGWLAWVFNGTIDDAVQQIPFCRPDQTSL
jgi:hypothetical protein